MICGKIRGVPKASKWILLVLTARSFLRVESQPLHSLNALTASCVSMPNEYKT